MRFEIYNGTYVGAAEWSAPGHIELDVNDAGQRAFFESYFAAEDSFLMGEIGSEELVLERRNSSPEAFARAAHHLAAYSYKVRDRASPAGRTERASDEGG